MGTFRILPTFKTNGGIPIINGSDPVPPDYAGWVIDPPVTTILNGLNTGTGISVDIFTDTGNNAYVDTLRFSFSGDSIYLDGSSTPISFAGLPAGFKVTSAQVKAVVDAVDPPISGLASCFLQQDNGNNGSAVTTPGSPTYPYDFPGEPFNPSMSDIVSNGCGFKVSLTCGFPPNDSGDIIISELYVEGTYSIESFQFPVVETTATGDKVAAGDTISVFSVPVQPNPPPPEPPLDDSTDLNLLNVTQIIIDYDCSGVPTTTIIPAADFTSQTWYQITFDLPTLDCNPSVIDLTLTVVGTQFSGSVPLGSLLTIFFTDGTGIYTLVPGKTADTLYVQDYDPVIEVDVKIPNPFAKTAFVGG